MNDIYVTETFRRLLEEAVAVGSNKNLLFGHTSVQLVNLVDTPVNEFLLLVSREGNVVVFLEVAEELLEAEGH